MASRTQTIESIPNAANLSKCHSQQQSSLFHLPAELRNSIFAYATMPHYSSNETDLRNHETDYYPGSLNKYITSTDLLLTCRRVWLEANHLPMLQAKHCFWNKGVKYVYTGDFFYREARRLADFITSLTPNNRLHLQEITLFVSSTWLQDMLPRQLNPLLSNSGACPRILTIVIDRLAWGSWRYDRPLVPLAEQPWLNELLTWPAPPRFRELRVVVENLEERMEEMRHVVCATRERLGRVERCDHFGDMRCLVLQEDSPPELRYSASSNPWLQRATAFTGNDRGECRVLTLVWRVEGSSAPREDPTSELEGDMVNLVHVPGPELPILSVESPRLVQPGSEDRVNEASTSGGERSTRAWKDRGSLLKFVA